MIVPTPSSSIAEAIQRIHAALPETTTLIAASKRQEEARVEAALKAGQRVFGENRVQEAQQRWAERRKQLPGLELHMIGPLQTNKAEEAVQLFDVIQTLDRAKLLAALTKAVKKSGTAPPDLMIQVNTGEEPQKAGVLIADLPDLIAETRRIWPGRLIGLMCIPPAAEPAAPHFALLKRLVSEFDLTACSMGMSQDYALAARLGATHVRVGTALFGARDS